MLGVVPRAGEQSQVIRLRHRALHRLRLHSAAIEHPLAPYYLGRAAIGRTPKSSNRPIGGIDVGQKIVID
jgi:hypothetical protein